MDDSEANLRIIRQLYSLLRPHAAGLSALLDRWDRSDPFAAPRAESAAPDELVSLMSHLGELPVSEVATLLEEAIEADRGDGTALDPDRTAEVLARLEARGRSTLDEIDAFARMRAPIAAPLPSDLHEAVRSEEARLEGALAATRARMLTKRDLRLLRGAEVSSETIEAIVRDAPTQDDVDELEARLRELREIHAASAAGASVAEQLAPLQAWGNAALELVGPILDPMAVQQLQEFAEPLFEPDDPRAEGS